MTHLPQAENQVSALDRRRRSLLRNGWDPAEVNRGFLVPRIAGSDWSAFQGEPAGTDPHRFLGVLLEVGKQAGLSKKAAVQLAADGLGSSLKLRRGPAEPWFEGHHPGSPERIGARLDRFFEWTESPAFGGMQPILQLSLTQLRLGELLPWEEHSKILGFWLGVLPLLEGGYLIPAYTSDHLARFGAALARGLAFDTVPLVGLNLDAALRSYELAEELGRGVLLPGSGQEF